METLSLINILQMTVVRRNEDAPCTKAGIIKIFFWFLMLLFADCLHAQNKDSLIHALLLNIQSIQVKEDGFFYAGMFPTYRECSGAPHNYQPDNTIFYTAIIAFALRNMLPYLPAEDKNIAQNLIAKIQKVYPRYRNKHGYPYYGFWATDDPIMPGTYYFKYLKQVFGQGEDADDT